MYSSEIVTAKMGGSESLPKDAFENAEACANRFWGWWGALADWPQGELLD
jgi:hypothetical protein